MKKLIGTVLMLSLMLSMFVGGTVLADDPPKTTVNFEGSNPDVTINSQAQLKAGYSTYRETSMFALTGTGDVVGEITATTGTYHCCTTLPKAGLSGGYTASNGDFTSVFESSNAMWKSNPYANTKPQFESAMFLSQHSLLATGVTSMTVMGDTSAKIGWGQPLLVSQDFGGNALDVDISGFNTRYEMIVDSNLHPILDAQGNFQFPPASDVVTVNLDGSAKGSSPIDFSGYTGGQYRNYTVPGELNTSDRKSSFSYGLWLQDPKYSVYPNPLTADVDVYAPGASLMTINAFVSGDPEEVWGDISIDYFTP